MMMSDDNTNTKRNNDGETDMGVPDGGAAASPVCWANKASRAIFATQSGNIGLL
jgi:hypothetical protein